MKQIVKLNYEDTRLREIINDMLRGHGVSFVNGGITIETDSIIKTDNGCEYHVPGMRAVIGDYDTGEVEDVSDMMDDRLDAIFETMDRNGEEVESCYTELVIRKRIKIG